MGFIDFIKDAGEKVTGMFGGNDEKAEAEAAAALSDNVKTLGIPVEDLVIQINDDTATVGGVTPSQADREKVVLVVGNTKGIARVDDQIRVEPPKIEAKYYTVKSGDSLSKIAKEYYGDPMKYPVIFQANQPMLKSPDLIYPGQVLRIPTLK